MIEKTNEELMFSTKDELDFYNSCVKGLPGRYGLNGNYADKYGHEIPYGSQAHIAKHFKTVIEIVQPKHILEIGFNLGWGTSLFLNLSDVTVTSCDISDRDETMLAGNVLKEQFGNRFDFYFRNELPESSDYYDLVFIDGDHKKGSVVKDILLSKKYNIRYLLFDDCYKRFGDAMDAIAEFPELILVHDMDNLKLYTWGSR